MIPTPKATIPLFFTRAASYHPLIPYLLGTIGCALGSWGHFFAPNLLWQLVTWLSFTSLVCCDTRTGRYFGRFIWAPSALVLNYSPMLLVLNYEGKPWEMLLGEYSHVFFTAIGCSFLLGVISASIGSLISMLIRFTWANLFCYAVGFGTALEVFDRLGLPVRPFSSELHASLLGWYALPYGLGLAYAAFFLLFSLVWLVKWGWLTLPVWFVPASMFISVTEQQLPVIPIENVGEWQKQTKKGIFVCGQGSLPVGISSIQFKEWKAHARETESIIVMEGEMHDRQGRENVVLIVTPTGAIVQPSFAGEGFIHAKSWEGAIKQIYREFTKPNISNPRTIHGFEGRVQLVFCYQNSQSWRFDRGSPSLVLNLGDLSLFNERWVSIWQREQLSRIQAQTHAQVVSSNKVATTRTAP